MSVICEGRETVMLVPGGTGAEKLPPGRPSDIERMDVPPGLVTALAAELWG